LKSKSEVIESPDKSKLTLSKQESSSGKNNDFNTITHPHQYFVKKYDDVVRVKNEKGIKIPVGFDEWDSLA
jgi:hypothetical protein